MWLLRFDMRSLAAELSIEIRRPKPFDEKDADYHLRKHKLRRLGESVSGYYFSDVSPTEMVENRSRYFIATQVEEAEEF